MRTTTWDAVLAGVQALSRGEYVCFADAPEHGGERVAVAQDVDDLGADEDVPAEAVALGLTRSLDMDAILQVRANLRAQGAPTDLGTLRRAVAYYIDRDAFLEITSSARLQDGE